MPDRTQENLARIRACDADWNENDHPRADNGQFTSGSGGGGAKVSKLQSGGKASNHPEGEAHNMMVGAMESAGGDFYTAKNKLLNNPRISQEVKNAVKKMKAPAGAKPQSMDGLVQHYIDKGDNERASIAIQLRMEMMDGHDLRGAVHNLLSKYDEAEDKGWMDRESYDKNVDMLLNEVSGDAYSALNPAKPAPAPAAKPAKADANKAAKEKIFKEAAAASKKTAAAKAKKESEQAARTLKKADSEIAKAKAAGDIKSQMFWEAAKNRASKIAAMRQLAQAAAAKPAPAPAAKPQPKAAKPAKSVEQLENEYKDAFNRYVAFTENAKGLHDLYRNPEIYKQAMQIAKQKAIKAEKAYMKASEKQEKQAKPDAKPSAPAKPQPKAAKNNGGLESYKYKPPSKLEGFPIVMASKKTNSGLGGGNRFKFGFKKYKDGIMIRYVDDYWDSSDYAFVPLKNPTLENAYSYSDNASSKTVSALKDSLVTNEELGKIARQLK